ncbi:hypothetical protein V1517DRAFT_338942 [Lipomyces orientalis]|uniref:Uncharacterized protein n=1 Tax=Lipomyces orientalis TaxID=1233043 RepID=A0ACC3TMI6_9ASCO
MKHMRPAIASKAEIKRVLRNPRTTAKASYVDGLDLPKLSEKEEVGRDKFIDYDVDTRLNSTFRMLDNALATQPQVDEFLQYIGFPRFTAADWKRLRQIYTVLLQFNELTLVISEKKPQISLAVSVYYEIHDLLEEVSERKEEFSSLDIDS